MRELRSTIDEILYYPGEYDVQGDAALLLRARRRAGRHEGRRREGDLVAREAVRGTAERPRRDG